jgi:hypothetical protein
MTEQYRKTPLEQFRKNPNETYNVTKNFDEWYMNRFDTAQTMERVVDKYGAYWLLDNCPKMSFMLAPVALVSGRSIMAKEFYFTDWNKNTDPLKDKEFYLLDVWYVAPMPQFYNADGTPADNPTIVAPMWLLRYAERE